MFVVRRISKSAIKHYCYSTCRQGKRVIRRYEGTATAEQGEQFKELRRIQEQAREQRKRERAPDEGEQRLAERVAESIRLAHAALEAAGYRSVGGHWRSRRKGRPRQRR